ncbi:MAG: TIGR00266 family protein [Acidimicrobiia bacterium]|nr:TIGR00266 family protein [Acidimicrobiia bacterium]
MQITTRHTPAFGVARLELADGEAVRIQSGAMMAMSPGVNIEARMEGGFMRSLKRAALGGESFFLTTCTAPSGGGWVDVSPQLPGDLTALDVSPGQGLVISRGAWLGSPPAVVIDTKWGGFRNLFGSEGGFIVHASGTGPTVVACYGALETWNLAAGQTVTVDTGHMVAYDDSVTMQLRKIAGGVVQSAKSGEGLVFDFTGPGRVLTQTRNPNELLGWIAAAIKPNTA